MHKFQSVPALNLSNKVFNYMSPMIITWSESNEQFEFQGKSQWYYWKWWFNTFIVAGLIGFGSCADVILHMKEVEGSLVVISCGFASLSFLFWACAAVTIWNVDEVVAGIKHLKNVFKYLGHSQNHGKPRIQTATRTGRMASIAIQLGVFGIAIIPFGMTPLCVWVGLDPFIYTFPKIVSVFGIGDSTCNNSCICIVDIIVVAARAICAIICATEACRFFAILFCMLIYTVELVVGCIEILSRANLANDCVYDNLSFLQGYTALQIAHRVIYSYVCSLFALFMGDGFFIILSCSLATIRAYDILPIEMYWFMPLVAMIFSFFIAFSLPFAVKVHEASKRMLYARQVVLISHREFLTVKKRKLIKREAIATRPITFSCGTFYDLKKGAESTYFYFIFLKTVDGLLI